MSSGQLWKSADESSVENIREAIQWQDLRCLSQRKLNAHLIRRFRERKKDIARFEGLGGRRGLERVEVERWGLRRRGLKEDAPT